MTILIIANWKMNPQTLKEAKILFEGVEKGVKKIKNMEVVICPPFDYLSDLKISGDIKLGAQDCFWEQKGAYTGEISPAMLKNLNCFYIIVGHSERRQFLNETNEMVNKKVKAVLRAGLNPILCVGEKEGEDMGFIVEEQLRQGLKDISANQVRNIVIAYEPVWAIGTDKACLADDAMKAFLFVKKILTRLYERNIAEKMRILYGGSVDSKNAADYVKKIGMAGLLVGGASLNAAEFLKIVESIKVGLQ